MPRKRTNIPWLGQRGGVFYVFWYSTDTRQTERLSLRTRDEGEAKNRYAAFLAEGRPITHPLTKGLTVERALADYLNEHVKANCADPVRQENAITHLVAFFGHLLLTEVNVERSRAYAAARRAGKIGTGRNHGTDKRGSDATIRREMSVLVAAANHAVWMERLATPICVDLPAAHVKGEDDEALYYTKAEVQRLIDAAEGELRWYIELAYWTGARRASIENLTRDQVKLDRNRILLKPTAKKATKKRQPIVPILDEMRPALGALLATGGEVRLFKRYEFYHVFRALAETLGLPVDKRHPHLLRHSRITHLLQDGVPLYSVARLIGDTPATIEMVYGHHAADYLADELRGARKLATGVSDL